MTDLDLFDRYLLLLRQERLEQSHNTLVVGDTGWAEKARVLACQAELVNRIRDALKDLGRGPDRFIEKHLRREQ